MTAEMPFKRARNTFSDVLEGNIPLGKAKPTILKQNEPKKIKSIFRYDQKIDMSQYRDVSVKHLLYGGKQTSLKRLCQNGSDRKIGIPWAQFQGDHMNALYKLAHDLDGSIYIRKDDHRARITYFIFSKKEDAESAMQRTFSHNHKEIEMYQTEKIEEEITVVNIPNLGDVDKLTLLDLIKETIEPISEIIDISALCRKRLTEFLPYGVKILFKKNLLKQLFQASLTMTSAESAEFKAVDKGIEPPAAKLIESDTKESDDTTPPVRRRGTVGLKRPPSCSAAMTLTEQPKKIAPYNKEYITKSDNLSTEMLKIPDNKCKKIISSDEETLKIKENKKFINLSSSPRSSDSDGYSPPTVLDRMAEKARNGEITEEQYIIFQEEYVLKNFTQSEVEMDSCTDDGDGLGSSETHSQMDTDTDL
ncbi:hypothetical protein AYI69_g8420 [Smittium culicis]|uniref:Uncharacterized protein n=1 Tax=Smittium culicis TaxID=133412 RepID=A0A1R1XJR2_9FUNG|nr:hypothetical protein AYI69_g8420 [Smittium culicis]